MKAPDFWHHRSPNGHLPWQAILLQPLAMLYQTGYKFRRAYITPQHLNVPVICVGNLVAGGAGKTPVVAELCAVLRASGYMPHIISRGYGATIPHVARVNATHTANDVGDEPLLLSRHAPCWVAADRHAAALEAQSNGADCLIMDDGFQNPSLHKDINCVVIDGQYGLGNGATLPAGPLRESFNYGMARAQIMIVIGHDQYCLRTQSPSTVTTLNYHIVPDVPEICRTMPLVAFCGIGRPQKFYTTLQAEDLHVVATKDFADHHPYSNAEFDALCAQANHLEAMLVTTEKDWMRLSPEQRKHVTMIPITLSADENNNTTLSAACSAWLRL